ncbi:MAG: hypothetical protein K2M82_01185 [Lachnospiraceae bacterium]|nr:hypothetical protein [Lachnospiraceae bacterium]
MSHDVNNDEKLNISGNNRGRKKKKSLPFGCSSRVAVCLVFCIICSAVVLVVACWDSFSPKGISSWFSAAGTSEEDFPVDIEGTNILDNNIGYVNGSLVYVSDTSVVSLMNNGEQKFVEQHNFLNPAIKTHGFKSIAYNVGGNNYRIISENEEVYEGTQGSAITDCDISPTGFYGVLSDQAGYLSVFFVYNPQNEVIFSYSFNDYYAVSVAMNESGTMAAIGAVNTDNGEMVSKVYILDFTKTEPINVLTYNDRIVYGIEPVTDKSFAVVTDSSLSVVSTDKLVENVYSFEQKTLTSYDVSYDNSIAVSLSRSDDKRDCCIVYMDVEGNELNTISTNLKITSLSICDDRIACLADSQLVVYNGYGDEFGTWEVGSDARCAILSQTKTAYILGVSEIRRYSLK